MKAPGDIRSNMMRGGAANAADFTPRKHEIRATIGPELRRRGLSPAGIAMTGVAILDPFKL